MRNRIELLSKMTTVVKKESTESLKGRLMNVVEKAFREEIIAFVFNEPLHNWWYDKELFNTGASIKIDHCTVYDFNIILHLKGLELKPLAFDNTLKDREELLRILNNEAYRKQFDMEIFYNGFKIHLEFTDEVRFDKERMRSLILGE